MSFRNYLSTQLAYKGDRNFLLIGEHHSDASATVALAHCHDLVKQSKKDILIFSEALPRKMERNLWNMLGMGSAKDEPYTVDEIKLLLKKNDKDLDALICLIENGAKVYGVESPATSPVASFKGTTKEAVLAEAQSKLPFLFKDPKIQKQCIELLEEKSITVDVVKDAINSLYGRSNQRITIPNELFSSQIIEVAKSNQGACTVIFVGGAAHIPKVLSRKESGKTIDQGMLETMKKKGCQVDACFVTTSIVKDQKAPYSPQSDDQCSFGVIPNQFQTQKSYKKNVSEVKSIAKNDSTFGKPSEGGLLVSKKAVTPEAKGDQKSSPSIKSKL